MALKLLKFALVILRYRVHISFIYFFLVWFAWKNQTSANVHWGVVCAFTFWHYALYLFDRAYDAEKDILSQQEEAVPTAQKNYLILVSILISTIPFFIFTFYKLPLLPYLFLFPFTFLYTYPIFYGQKRFKDFFLVKNLYSSVIIWTLSIFFMLKCYANIPNADVLFYFKSFGGLLLMTTIGEIHWDMRDIASDTKNGVNTLPVVLGLNQTKWIIVVALILSYFLGHLLSSFSLVMMLVLVYLAGKKVSNFIYHLPPLVALFNFITHVA
ncbi:MAG: UbiA family prenyltransferase [Chitinophagales bacterium]|nr:UbiA family prenyltransferase [Chitinophagales bacterium]